MKNPNKRSTVRHTRAIQTDHIKRATQPPPDQEIEQRIKDLLDPATFSQVRHYQDLGLRERTLTLPVMVAFVLSLLWRQMGSVKEAVRVLNREGMLWCSPVSVSHQAVNQRLRCLPAPLFEGVFEEILQAVSRLRWRSVLHGTVLALLMSHVLSPIPVLAGVAGVRRHAGARALIPAHEIQYGYFPSLDGRYTVESFFGECEIPFISLYRIAGSRDRARVPVWKNKSTIRGFLWLPDRPHTLLFATDASESEVCGIFIWDGGAHTRYLVHAPDPTIQGFELVGVAPGGGTLVYRFWPTLNVYSRNFYPRIRQMRLGGQTREALSRPNGRRRP